MTNTNEDLGKQMERLVAEHIAATRRELSHVTLAQGGTSDVRTVGVEDPDLRR